MQAYVLYGFHPLEITCHVQALGILVQLEGPKFGRRVASVLPLVAACLHNGVCSMEQDQDVTDAGEQAESAVTGWQEVYACLLLLEKLATFVPNQVSCIDCPWLVWRDAGVYLQQILLVQSISRPAAILEALFEASGWYVAYKRQGMLLTASKTSMPDCYICPIVIVI